MSRAELAINGGTPTFEGLPDFPVWPQPSGEAADALQAVQQSGKWGSTAGDVVQTFEARFAQFQQAKHAIAVSNGTMGLVASLRAAGIGLGDEVIVPPYTFIATASSALFAGAIPVFADVDPDTHLLDPAAAEAAITERTKAIIPVHLAGNVADMDAFNALGERYGLTIIEDSAQAIGAAWNGRPVGAIGSVGSFSFQSSKNMTAGEGGIITTDDDTLASAVYSTVNVGRVKGGGWYQHEHVGFNLRITEFQGAILHTQLDSFPNFQATRVKNAQLLASLLDDVAGVQVDRQDSRVTAHGYHLFMMRVPELGTRNLRDEAVKALAAEGVEGASTGYVPLHRNDAVMKEMQAACERFRQPAPQPHCPNADIVCADTIWLPHRLLMGTEEQTRAIATATEKVIGGIT